MNSQEKFYESLENTNNTNSTSEILSFTDVENSPFTIVKDEDSYFVTMGNYRLTEKVDSYEKALEETKMTWDRVLQVFLVLLDKQDEIEKLKKINNN